MTINVTRPSMPSFEEYCDEIRELWDSHWLTNTGTKHEQFQAMLEEYLDCPHVTLFANGHLSLENVIEVMNFPPGSEIITTPLTFPSTTHAIVRNGLVPIFCDISEKNLTIDPEKIEKLITPRTVAIIPVHIYGHVCDVEKIETIAKSHDLKVIYDAAHAFGVKYKGVSVANFGDASVFSFHATKVFNTAEGGAVCFCDPDIAAALDEIKNFGITGHESVERIGGNGKMSEFHAAMGICNLRHAEDEILKRKAVYERYNERLSDINGIKLFRTQKDVESNYSYYPVVFDGYKYSRDKIYELLKQHDIYARKYFYPLVSDLNSYKGRSYADSSKTPIARSISNNILTLPLYSDLSLCDVDRICDIVLG